MAKQDKDLIKFEHDCRMKEIKERRQAEMDIENLKFEHQIVLQKLKEEGIKQSIQSKSRRMYG